MGKVRWQLHRLECRLDADGAGSHPETDFLADEGRGFDKSIYSAESVRRRLRYALQWVLVAL